MVWAILSRSTDLLALIGLCTVVFLSVRFALWASRLIARATESRAARHRPGSRPAPLRDFDR